MNWALVALLLSSQNAMAAAEIAGEALEEWRETMTRTPLPYEGCFEAHFPNVVWDDVECVAVPEIPMAVGNAYGDYMASVSSGSIGFSQGSIGTGGVTSETDSIYGANLYSLQLNTNFFNTALCSGAWNPSICYGWQQFVYVSEGSNPGFAAMVYQLVNYRTSCPSGWNRDGDHCFKWSSGVSVPVQSIAALNGMLVTAQIITSPTPPFTTYYDAVGVTIGGTFYSMSANDNVLNLRSKWTAAEFNVFGRGNGSRANFNAGSSASIDLIVKNGTTNAPTCFFDSRTAETNNLNLAGSCQTFSGSAPKIRFGESN